MGPRVSRQRRRALSRRRLALWLGSGALALAGFFLLGWIQLPSGPAFSICAFRRMTGIPCPGCGMTRAVSALARGQFLLALHFHPFAPLLLAEAGAAWAAIGRAVAQAMRNSNGALVSKAAASPMA